MAGASFDTSILDNLTEGDIDRLASELGVSGDDDDNQQPKPDAGTEPKGDAPKGDDQPAPVDGGPKDGEPPPSDGGQSKVSGKALIDMLQGDPEAQQLIRSQLEGWLKQASATADARKEREEFDELIRTGDYEKIGRKYVTDQQTEAIRSSAANEAQIAAYTDIYGRLFGTSEIQAWTPDEKVKYDAANYETDAEYVLALTDFIASKRAEASDEERVNTLVNTKLETLKNMKSSEAARGTSISSLPAGRALDEGESRGSDSRSLIKEGLIEAMEAQANNRVMT